MNIGDPQQEETVGQAFADYLNLVNEAVAQISTTDIRARISRAMNQGVPNSAPVFASHGAPTRRAFADTSGPGAPNELRTREELLGSRAGTVSADTALRSRVGVCRAQSRDVRRTADRVVADSDSLMIPGGDLRMMSTGKREETRAAVAEWRQLMRACPAGVFGTEGTAMILGPAAALAEKLIADRDEHTALDLIQAVTPHLSYLGRHHPAGFELRRARAEALSELGQYRQAETRLRWLSQDEQQVLGSADPRTELLLGWALVGQDQLWKANDRFRSLANRLTRSPDTDPQLLQHLQCRHSWLRGRMGLVDQSVRDYAHVIASRTHELGEHHADTLDARHSQAKTLIAAGQGSQALTLLQPLADDRARVQGDRHPDTLETLKYLHLAQVQAEPHNDSVVERAIQELIEVHRIQRERHGHDHPLQHDTAKSLCKLLRREPISGLRHIPIEDEEHRQRIPWSRSRGPSRNTQSTPV